MDFRVLEQVLNDDDLSAAFEAASEEFDTDRVDVAIDIEGFDEPLVLQITQIEVESDDEQEFEMIQIFVPIPLELKEEAVDEIVGVLPDINQQVPLIGFNVDIVDIEERFVYFRHVMLAPEGETGAQLVTEAVWLSQYAVDTFALQFLEFA